MNSYGEKLTITKKLKMCIRICATQISPDINSKLNFILGKKTMPDFKNPRTLDEKLMWLKLNYYANDLTVKQCADKYGVRQYLKDKGYQELLNNLLFAVDTVDDIPWASLPDRFAIKWSFGSGYNIICSDKSTFDRKLAKRNLKMWGRIPYWKLYSEMQYKDTQTKLIGERFLQNKDGGFPLDYKFYCFNGCPKCVMVCTERETGTPKFYFFDRDWKLLRINRWGKIAPKDFMIEKPETMDSMFQLAQELSAPFPFVRLDLYDQDGKVIFGEFTFAPSSGVDPNRLPETDIYFGNLLDIKNLKNM